MSTKRKPAAAPAPAPKATTPRKRLPAKQRALEALRTATLATVGHEGLAELLGRATCLAEELPDHWQPVKAVVGPLGPGDLAWPKTGAASYHGLACPLTIKETYKQGRSLRCTVVSVSGTVGVGLLVSELTRFAPFTAKVDAEPAAAPIEE